MSNKYVLKLWLITIVCGPIIFIILESFRKGRNQVIGLLELIPILIIFSVIFSIPSLIAALLLKKVFSNFDMPIWVWKSSVALSTIIGIVLTLTFIGGPLIPTLTLAYCISLFSSAIVLEIISKN